MPIQSAVSTTLPTLSANPLPNPPPTPLQKATPTAMIVEAMMAGHAWVGRVERRSKGMGRVSLARAVDMITLMEEEGKT